MIEKTQEKEAKISLEEELKNNKIPLSPCPDHGDTARISAPDNISDTYHIWCSEQDMGEKCMMAFEKTLTEAIHYWNRRCKEYKEIKENMLRGK